MLFSVITGPSRSDICRQMAQSASLAEALEIRCDLLDFWDLPFFHSCILSSRLPVLLTLRSKDQGGHFSGSQEEQQRRWKELASCHPAFLDLEFPLSSAWIQGLKQKFPSVALILSHHVETAVEGVSSARKMLHPAIALHKVAMRVGSSTEILALCDFLRQHPQNSYLFVATNALSDAGRVLPKIFGSQGSFGCLEPSQRSAAGQLTLQAMSEIYRYRKLNAETRICGLIGDPIEASIGHLYHNRFYEKLGLNAVYLKFPVKKQELASFLSYAKKLGIHGLSVTSPHKESVLPLLDTLSEEAEAAGAANTIRFVDGKAHGIQTDGQGACRAIRELIQVRGSRVLILGAGGSARAIARKLTHEGAEVTLLNRTASRARELAQRIGCSWQPMEQLEKSLQECDLFIQTTPADPWIPCEWLRPSLVYMDIRIGQRCELPCRSISWESMYRYQAQEQIRFWFEKNPAEWQDLRGCLQNPIG